VPRGNEALILQRKLSDLLFFTEAYEATTYIECAVIVKLRTCLGLSINGSRPGAGDAIHFAGGAETAYLAGTK